MKTIISRRALLAALGGGLILTRFSGLGASDKNQALAQTLTQTLAKRVDAHGGEDPVFLRSYDGRAADGEADADPALATAAFTYDNALAVIALLAGGCKAQAERIGNALLAAVQHDRAGSTGRLRNTYRAGPQTEAPQPNGWWDKGRMQWVEDDYQVGTATGNVAWAGLALMMLAEKTGQARFADGAASLGLWAVTHAGSAKGPGGFTGGIHGGEAAEKPLGWKSSEHNIDLAALFWRLDHFGVKERWPGFWRDQSQEAKGFLQAMWDDQTGYFLTGTAPDGVTPNRSTSGLDVQFWAQLLPNAPQSWRRAVTYAETAHGVSGGFSFNNDRAGLWTEGTAQAALTYKVLGDTDKAAACLSSVAAQVSPDGLLWATPLDKLPTGLTIGPDSKIPDFFYYHQPHLGATAWAAIAALGINPMTGAMV